VAKSEFASKGVPNGFIITKIDKQKVNSTEQLMQMIKNKKGFVFIEGLKPSGLEDAYVLQLK
jgi:S1-C subfamily serine protease